MDYTKQTKEFWINVNKAKKERRMTWQDISDSCGHSAASISTMSNMNKMPSLGFAMSIAKALGKPIGSLWPLNENSSVYDGSDDMRFNDPETGYGTEAKSTEFTQENLKKAHDILSALLYALDKGALDKD